MMAKRRWTSRQTNLLKWTADLLKLDERLDPETDRVEKDYFFERKIRYNNIGVTVTDNAFLERDTDRVVKKIEVRIDRAIENNQKEYRIRIKTKVDEKTELVRIYKIQRIYVREEDRVMEVSLSYAN